VTNTTALQQYISICHVQQLTLGIHSFTSIAEKIHDQPPTTTKPNKIHGTSPCLVSTHKVPQRYDYRIEIAEMHLAQCRLCQLNVTSRLGPRNVQNKSTKTCPNSTFFLGFPPHCACIQLLPQSIQNKHSTLFHL
jgi:hypothetical protein